MSLVVDIRKRLGGFSLDVSFETQDLITGFLGPSGCGKTMTLKCIAGIESPDSGHIELDGNVLYDSKRRIDLKPQQRKVGYLFQNYALFPTMSVRDNILCGLHFEKERSVKDEKCRSLIGLLRLEGLEDHRPYQLSGGQAQRTALARMLASEPKLLLLDEPFSALDSYLRKNLQIELTDLITSVGKQALLVTHSQREVRRMCSSLYVMKNGHFIRNGRTEDVFENPGSEDCAILLED